MASHLIALPSSQGVSLGRIENVRITTASTPLPAALTFTGADIVGSNSYKGRDYFDLVTPWIAGGYTGPTIYAFVKSSSTTQPPPATAPTSVGFALLKDFVGTAPNKLDVIRLQQTSTSPVGPYSISGLILFKTKEMTGVRQSDVVTLAAGDTLSGLFAREGGSAARFDVRWVVENDGDWYISGPTSALAGTAASPATISQTAGSLSWFEFDPATSIETIGAAANPSLDDVDWIGYRVDGDKGTGETGRLRFSATQLSFDVTVAPGLPSRLIPHAALHPLSDGFLDVTKAPYSADPTGTAVSTTAIQDAIDDAHATNLVVFFPPGTYLCDAMLDCTKRRGAGGTTSFSQCKFVHKLVGSTQGAGRPVLKLQDGATGVTHFLRYRWYGDQGGGSEVEEPSRKYCALLRGIDIDLGNNPTVNGIRMYGAQYCAIEDVHIYGTDFAYGINGLPGSGGSVSNVKVTGGDCGIYHAWQHRPTPLLTGVELIGQTHRAIEIGPLRQALVVAGFRIEAPPSPGAGYIAVEASSSWVAGGGINPSTGNLVMVDGSIEVAGSGGLAIRNARQDVNLQNVYIKAANLIESGAYSGSPVTVAGDPAAWREVQRYAFGVQEDESHFHVDGTNFDTTTADQQLSLVRPATMPPVDLVSRHLWGAGFPSWEDANLIRVTDPTFGATPDDPTDDDTIAIQAALDAAATVGGPHEGKTVFLPRGVYDVASPIVVPIGGKLIGPSQSHCLLRAKLDWLPTSETAIVSTEDAVGDVILANFGVVRRAANVAAGNEAQSLIGYARIRSSGTIWRNLIMDDQGLAGDDYREVAPMVIMEGNAGGKFYNVNLEGRSGDWDTGHPDPDYHLLHIRGNAAPITIYAPSIEHFSEGPAQFAVDDAAQVRVFGFKYEGHEKILSAKRTQGLHVFGGSGNYSEPILGDQSLISIDRCSDVRIANVSRQSSNEGNASWLKGQGHDFLDDVSFALFAHLEDLNGDEIPDIWQRHHFGAATTPDTPIPATSAAGGNGDDDTLRNIDEFVLGRDPNLADNDPSDVSGMSQVGSSLFFDLFAREASGVGYSGLERVYQLCSSTDLVTWEPVPGVAEVIGDDTYVQVEVPLASLPPGARQFFKFVVEVR